MTVAAMALSQAALADLRRLEASWTYGTDECPWGDAYHEHCDSVASDWDVAREMYGELAADCDRMAAEEYAHDVAEGHIERQDDLEVRSTLCLPAPSDDDR